MLTVREDGIDRIDRTDRTDRTDVSAPVWLGLPAARPDTAATRPCRHLHRRADNRPASGALTVTPNLIEPPATWFPSIGREVANQAVETSANLIVMTTHARAVVPRMFVGSGALDVVRWSNAPVLLIKPPEPSRAVELSKGSLFHHVLVPLDFSRFSEEVLTPAIALGTAGAAQYTVLHALQLQHVLGVPVAPAPVPVSIGTLIPREAQAAAQEQLARVAARFRASNLVFRRAWSSIRIPRTPSFSAPTAREWT